MFSMIAKLLYLLKGPFHFVKTGLLVGLPAEIKTGFPQRKLKIICVTGTDGKTTSSTMLYQVLKTAGKKVALITTVAAYIGDDQIDTGFHVTTPDPGLLYQFFKRLVKEKYEYVVLETTSHGIYQHRLWGITPYMVGVTNITHEHLDYHIRYNWYVKAKASLVKKAQIGIINADDISYSKLKKELRQKPPQLKTFSIADSLPSPVNKAIKDRFPEVYNRMNARLVYKMAKLLDVQDQDFAAALKNFEGVPGRMQSQGKIKGVEVIVDFAHTPNALGAALLSLRQRLKAEKQKGKLIAVFGCAGLRDHTKRPLMGEVAAQLADYVVLTAEDPRTEDVWSIIRQIKERLPENQNKITSIADRGEAIEFAVTKLAKKNDIVGIFGKGHERSMCYGTVEYPWSDVEFTQQLKWQLSQK
jgi:UDP-N-acetylmuramoyl-L-alanyl-D-glutamate--2,6-diaminopimelate ligase